MIHTASFTELQREVVLMAYLLLFFSIMSEVLGSMMLKLTNGFKVFLPVIGMLIGYGISFYLFSLVIIELPLGFSYAIWSGVGTVLTTIAGIILFKEKVNKMGVCGICLIIVGVVLLNLG